MKITQPCPKCNRKGLHYADHPHAQGWKDYEHIDCRFCHTRFRAVDRIADATGRVTNYLKDNAGE